jgi:hypothetical protein
MPNANPATVVIAIPGGQETRELTLAAAHAAIASGEIEPHHWAWSPHQNEWIPVSKLPELQLLTEEPAPIPTVKVSSAVLAALQTENPPPTSASLIVKEEAGFSFFKLFVILLLFSIFGVIGANYVLIDQPLQASVARTTFYAVPVHAHLGAFVQPNALVIHILPDQTLNADNLADFLVALAGSTPQPPFGYEAFRTIGLTNNWTSQYVIPGDDWKSLAQMSKSTSEGKKAFILEHLLYLNGDPLMIKRINTNADALAQFRDKAWSALVAALIHH